MLGWLFVAVGILSTVYHLLKSSLDRWTVPIVLVGTVAVVAGSSCSGVQDGHAGSC